MSEWPKEFHPAGYSDEDGYVVDDTVTVLGYQVQPGTWDDAAAWCGGVQTWQPRGVAVGSLDMADRALFGDFVMRSAPDTYEVSRADGHYQRWAVVEEE